MKKNIEISLIDQYKRKIENCKNKEEKAKLEEELKILIKKNIDFNENFMSAVSKSLIVKL